MSRPRPTRLVLAGLAAVLALVALAGCLPSVGRPAVRQPAVAPRVWDNSDPFVLVADGRNYLFGSTNNMTMPVREITSYTGSLTDSQSQWGRNPYNAMPTIPAWLNTDHPEIWAPSAIKIGTLYYVYFGGRRAGASDTNNDQCIGRASSTTPMGPYRPEATPLYCGLPAEAGSNPWGRGALDPEVLRGADGNLYMVAAFSRTRDNIGAVKLASNGRVIGGINAVPAVLASQKFPWQDGTDDRTLRPTFLENPSMVYDPGTKTYLLFYSAGDWWTDRYVTGFARCSTPVGPCAMDGRGPFLRAGAGRTGVGALTAFRDAGGTLRVAYASWTAGYEGTSSSDGSTSRHVSWSRLILSPTDNASDQSVSLQE